MRKVIMPKLGETMEEGEIVTWLKHVGDFIEEGEPLVEVATDKANMEVESPASGYVRQLTADTGANVPVTETIAYLADSMDEEIPKAKTPAPSPQQEKTAPATSAPKKTKEPAPRERRKASPLARRLAREHGIELSDVQGTGPGGRIVKADVLEAQERKAAAGGRRATRAISRTQQLTAERMTRSKREIPHFYLTSEVAFLEARKLRADLIEEFEQDKKVHITYTDLIVAACARALKKYPTFNAHFAEGTPLLHDEVNIGLAIAGKEGLSVPVIRKTDEKSLFEIGRQREKLVDDARKGTLNLGDLEGGTFTVSNLGMMQVTTFYGIINYPQVALLATGAVKDRVIAWDGEIVVAPVMYMTLSCDHRAVDGYLAAQFLTEIRKGLEKPALLLVS